MSSGDAWDSDRAFLYGAAQSRRYQEIGARVFLARDGDNGRWVKDNPFYYNAELATPEAATTARSLALMARGSFYNLGEKGIKLHVRNVYQIHGIDLTELVSALYCYAEPNGKSKVHGGTNTALQLAKKAGVPIIHNLYFQETVDVVLEWLAENELDYPYTEIDWHQIHRPDDPRLTEFE